MFEIALLIIGLTWIAPFAHRSSEVAASPAQAHPTVSSAPTSTTATTGAEGGKVAVALDQWSVTPTATELPAGKVTFTVSNVGTITHEFVVLRTSTPAADIPIGSFEGEKNRINEDTAGTNVGETGDMQSGRTKTLTLNLRPGHYVFLCNLPSHYALGMHTDVTVSAA
jgi:uncharacterized cupredoxin-like copper-binding protein